MAETSKDAEAAFDAFIAASMPKYDKAAECLAKDRQALLAFYDFPAEHWKHLRTSNPIESTFATVRHRTFATVRHRTIRSKGCLSNKTALAMVFKLVGAAQKKMARARWPQPVDQAHSGCQGCRRDRNRRQPGGTSVPDRRRLSPQAITNIRR